LGFLAFFHDFSFSTPSNRLLNRCYSQRLSPKPEASRQRSR
jgi:hypothetical protein